MFSILLFSMLCHLLQVSKTISEAPFTKMYFYESKFRMTDIRFLMDEKGNFIYGSNFDRYSS